LETRGENEWYRKVNEKENKKEKTINRLKKGKENNVPQMQREREKVRDVKGKYKKDSGLFCQIILILTCTPKHHEYIKRNHIH